MSRPGVMPYSLLLGLLCRLPYSLLWGLPAAVPTALLCASTPLDTLLTADLGTMAGFHIQFAPSTTRVSPLMNLQPAACSQEGAEGLVVVVMRVVELMSLQPEGRRGFGCGTGLARSQRSGTRPVVGVDKGPHTIAPYILL